MGEMGMRGLDGRVGGDALVSHLLDHWSKFHAQAQSGVVAVTVFVGSEFPLPSFPRRRESMLTASETMDPRLRGDDAGFMKRSSLSSRNRAGAFWFFTTPTQSLCSHEDEALFPTLTGAA